MRWTIACGLLLVPPLGAAQSAATATEALAAALPALCSGSPQGELATRCAELLAAGGRSFGLAAGAQRLEELPGHARIADREGDDARPPGADTASSAWDLWVAASDGALERHDGRIEAGFEAGRQGLVVGGTWRPASRWTLDGGWQWLREDLDYTGSDGRARSRLDGPVLALLWSGSTHWSLEAQLAQVAGALDLRRSVRYALDSGTRVDATASARPRTRRRGIGLALRRHDSLAGWSFDSGLLVDRATTRIDAYRESGGLGWALALPQRERVSQRARLEATLSKAVSRPTGVWLPTLRLARLRELQDPQRTLAVRFAGDGAGFAVRFPTEEPDRDWWEASLGLAWLRPGGQAFFVDWRARHGHRFLDERQLSVGWRIER